MCFGKYQENTFGKNKDGLYTLLKQRVWSPFSSNSKMGDFAAVSIVQV
jgi:hypothetical protein